MIKKRTPAHIAMGDELDGIKRAGIVAMFADDELLDQLVLKGGNAMDIVLGVGSRASVDLDFSIRDDLDYEAVGPRLERALKGTYELHGYVAFDIGLSPRPGKMPDELAEFWGGYLVEFKLISATRASEAGYDLETMRREAIRLGEGSKFTIDISRREFVEGKVERELDGYRIFVYSPEMIVCEKLRAICQQMPAYAEVIRRKGLGNQRARDFVDIEAVVKRFNVDLSSDRVKETVSAMFEAKHVPVSLIGQINTTKDFHALGFDEVRAAMKPGAEMKGFDYYFEFVVEECKKLEALWNTNTPAADV